MKMLSKNIMWLNILFIGFEIVLLWEKWNATPVERREKLKNNIILGAPGWLIS